MDWGDVSTCLFLVQPSAHQGFYYPLQQEHLGKLPVGHSYESRPGLDTESYPQYRRQQTGVQHASQESLNLPNPASQTKLKPFDCSLEDPQREQAQEKRYCA